MLTLKNLALNLVYYAMTVGALPLGLLQLEARWWGDDHRPQLAVRVAAVALGLLSVSIQGWCIALLQRRGRGTPSLLAATAQLVTTGPYAWLRNPLNLSEVTVFLALAAWCASWILLIYASVAWLAFHLFVVLYEEPRHRRQFGAAYEAYASAVSRWLPRPPRTASTAV